MPNGSIVKEGERFIALRSASMALVCLLLSFALSRVSAQVHTNVVSGAPGAPGAISGPSSATGGTTSSYTATAGSNATSSVWTLTPSSAGTISGGFTSASVTWATSYSGTATILVHGVNANGSGASQSKSVSVTAGLTPLVAGVISPSSQTINYGTQPILTTTAMTGGTGSYTYQWTSSTVSNTGPFSAIPGTAATLASYSPPALTVTTYFQRQDTGTGPGGGGGAAAVKTAGVMSASSSGTTTTLTTNVATVIVYPQLVVSSLKPTIQSVLSGAQLNPIVGTATGGNGSLVYQWQSSPDNNNDWNAVAAGPNSGTFNPGTANNTIYYRLGVTSNGVTAYSSISTVAVSDCYQLNSAPSTAMNYITASVFREPGITSAITDAQIAGMGVCDVNQTIQYFDGLDRPIQTVLNKQSPVGNDVIQPVAYDPVGREVLKYLPYTDGVSPTGSYRATALLANSGQSGFYDPAGSTGTEQSNGIIRTDAPYSQTIFEPSSLNRPIEIGAPGDVWQPASSGITGSGHTVKMSYGTNQSEVTLWSINTNGNGATGAVAYPAGELNKTTTTDENGNNTILYKDMQGHIVCRIVKNGSIVLATSYVYDDQDNLTYVIPPIPSSTNASIPSYPSSFVETDALFLNYMYGYHYDQRHRAVQKKIPGKGWQFIVYNSLDQPIFTQDANQRNQTPQVWTYMQYDVQQRLAITGIWSSSGAPGSAGDNNVGTPNLTLYQWLINWANSQTTLWLSRDNTTATGYSAINPQGTVLNINYYDDYNFPGKPSTFSTPAGSSIMTSGLSTATKTVVLNTIGNTTPVMLWTVNYYDDLGRVTQTYKQHYLAANSSIYNYDEEINTYNFDNQIASTSRQHHNTTNTTSPVVIINNTYIYDQYGRKKQTLEQINAGVQILLSQIDYNEIGQPLTKHLHNTGNGFLQEIDYAYNERGWLNKINNPGTVSPTELFGEQIQYNDGPTPAYNGNISGVVWQAMVPPGLGLFQSLQSFSYNYDPLNRLTLATYTTPMAVGKFNELVNYDALGNITSLQRNNSVTTGSYLNNFTYDYTSQGAGNRLYSISDVGTALQSSSYGYDINGNVISDTKNKITNISFNLLNLPIMVSRTNGNINYLYDGNGSKLEKISGGITRDYISGIEYNNGVIEFISTEEGRAIPNGSSYSFEYYLKDHLGNTRVAFKDDGTVIQVQDYYAFGMEMNPGNSYSPSPGNQYKYNGKEEQTETNQYDYGARFYDPVIARWTSADPMAESNKRFSTYNYVENNPIRNIDPDGMMDVGSADYEGGSMDAEAYDASRNNASGVTYGLLKGRKHGPTGYQAALMSKASYPDWKGGNLDGWRIINLSDHSGLIPDVRWEDVGSSFYSKLFWKVEDDGTTSYVVGFAGSRDWTSWGNDLTQLVGSSTQYDIAAKNAPLISDWAKLQDASLTFTGHSLGGGLAALSSAITGDNAVTFNAAGISYITMLRYGLSNSDFNRVKAYVMTSDPVNHAQNMFWPLTNTAQGSIIPVYPKTLHQLLDGHDIQNFIDLLKH